MNINTIYTKVKDIANNFIELFPESLCKIVTVITFIVLILFLGNIIYNKIYSSDPVPVTLTKEEVKSPEAIKEKINNNQSTKITLNQAKEISKRIEKYEDEEPEEIIQTTKKDYEKVAAQKAKDVKADAVVIAPAKNETRDITKMDDNTPVNLNQYNIEAYPKHMLGVTYYSDHEVTVDYDIKFRLFGKSAYVGPAVKFDTKNGDVAGGVKLTIPF